jgi:SAM-dependent MidA family methyltransferase
MNAGRRITFEAFMAEALHDPKRGYYARHIEAVGRSGDFTTAPMLARSPARAIANRAASAMREAGCRNLIEIGPGEGTLAAEVLRHLPWHLRWKTRLHLVESSMRLREKQHNRLGNQASIHASMHEALAACGGRAVIYSNELVDAFPVRRFQKTIHGWQELEVEFQPGGTITEQLLPVGELPDSSIFRMDFPIGQWVEVHDSYRKWLEEWLPTWTCGRMLTIDYGATAERLYHRRPYGSIRGYLLHSRIVGAEIYQNIGRQDLTADVNFSDLIAWAAPWCETRDLENMRTFLQAHSMVGHPTETALLDEQGCGGAFLVLDQARLGSNC